jgi:hypothetical protein
LLRSHYTTADIFAERVVNHNDFSVITLDFSTQTSFSNSPITTLFHSMGFQPNGFDVGAIRMQRKTSSVLKYHMKTVKTNGDDALCGALNLEVLSRSFGKVYDGRVMDLSLDSHISDDNPADWIFFVSLDDRNPALKNKICEFNFDVKTYRSNPNEQGGIFAERIVGNVISSGMW